MIPDHYHEADAVKVKLLHGVLYADDIAAWECLLRNEDPIRAFFAPLAQEVEIDRGEGYAWLRQVEAGDDAPPHFPPRLFRRTPLSFDVTLLCVLLRERLLSFERAQADMTKLVLSRDDLLAMLETFFDTSGDELRRRRDFRAVNGATCSAHTAANSRRIPVARASVICARRASFQSCSPRSETTGSARKSRSRRCCTSRAISLRQSTSSSSRNASFPSPQTSCWTALRSSSGANCRSAACAGLESSRHIARTFVSSCTSARKRRSTS